MISLVIGNDNTIETRRETISPIRALRRSRGVNGNLEWPLIGARTRHVQYSRRKHARAQRRGTNTRRGKVDWEREANGITADIPVQFSSIFQRCSFSFQAATASKLGRPIRRMRVSAFAVNWARLLDGSLQEFRFCLLCVLEGGHRLASSNVEGT